MNIIGYGEDALTIWSLTRNLSRVLQALDDSTEPSRCRAFLRPSFGRGGGDHSAKFGEFDFILLAEDRLYLGESKWEVSSERVRDNTLVLGPSQVRRHKVFQFYVQERAFGRKSSWQEFVKTASPRLQAALGGIPKPLAPVDSLLASNLQTVLRIIQSHYVSLPDIVNVVLYFHHNAPGVRVPQRATDSFVLVPIDYSAVADDNFIQF